MQRRPGVLIKSERKVLTLLAEGPTQKRKWNCDMTGENFYNIEKLGAATRELATGPGRINERLLGAVSGSFYLIQQDRLPKELVDQYSDIYSAVIAREAKGGEGSFAASIAAMSEDEASQIAAQIFDLYVQLKGEVAGGRA